MTGRPGGRGAVAGIALAAAGLIYSRLGRRRGESEARTLPDEGRASSGELERARAELARELAQRASRAGR